MAKAKIEVIDRDEQRKQRGTVDDSRGPTKQRWQRGQGDYVTGDDKQGGKVYQFVDTALDRLYGRLVRASRNDRDTDILGVEYAALRRYERLFVESGMVGSIGSVDCNRVYSPDPSNRMFLAATEKQLDDRNSWWWARSKLDKDSHVPRIVVDNVVCFGHSLEIAGYAIGKVSKTRAIKAAEDILRASAYKLAVGWGMIKLNA